MASPSFGQELPDQVDRIAALTDAQLALLSDVREIYKDRAALEKEYAGKLAALAKRASDRKAKRMASLVVGDDPTVAWGEDTLRRSTLDNAYTQLISSLENIAQDHSALSDQLTTQVVDTSKTLEKKYDDMKTKQFQFYQKLLSDRDKVYSERLKAKQKYDEECLVIDTYRKKQDRSQDDKHANRAAKQLESQTIDMHNNKNTFIINTAIANQVKGRFYTQDLPLLEDSIQRLQTNLIAGLMGILLQGQNQHNNHLTTLQKRVGAATQAIQAINTSTDQELYINYNKRPFSVPNDWGWEPCAGYYDTGEMAVDPAPKVLLQNKLSRSRAKLDETTRLIEPKKRDLEKLSNIVERYMADRSLGSIDDVLNDYFGVQQQVIPQEFAATVLSAEIDTISDSLRGDEGSQSPHNFKSTSFAVPTTCGYCKSSIWGLTKQGKSCKTCGLCVHSKCELKVPANCGGATRGSGPPKSAVANVGADLSRADSRASTMSQNTISSNAPSILQSSVIPDESHPSAKILFDFTPTSPFELAVTEGTMVQVIEDDDGSGWVKVADSVGGSGLVPASYIEIVEEAPAPIVKKKAPPPPVPRGSKPKPTLGSGKFVRSLYTWDGDGGDELPLTEGGTYELSAGPKGGENYADGWWEGYDTSGRKGIFPSNYVEHV